MATLAVMKARIATELARDNLTSEIASAITSAIEHHETERFWFNQSRTITFSTVAAQVAYSTADNAYLPNLIRTDAVFYYTSTQIWELDRFDPVDFEFVANNASTGRPTAFTYVDSTIRLWPTPDAAYTMRVHAHYKLAAISADGDTNAWTTEAEELIRTAAKLRLALDVTKDEAEATRMQVKMEPLLERLRTETSSRQATGVIRPVDF